MRYRSSIRRIVFWSVLLGLPLVAAIVQFMFPRLLTLEAYRPVILSQLRAASGRRVTIGALHASLFPPSLVADDVVVLEQGPPHRPILLAKQVRLRLRTKSLLQGSIQIRAAVILRPRLILYTDRVIFGSSTTAKTSVPDRLPLKLVIHDGTIELGGPLWGQKIRWNIDHVEATVEGTERNIQLSARPSFLGPLAALWVTMNPNAEKPVHAELKTANLDRLFSLFGSTVTTEWRGTRLDARADASWPVMQNLVLQIDSLTVPSLPKASIHGTLKITKTSVQGSMQFEGLVSSMTVKEQWVSRRKGWDVSARVERYSPEIARYLPDNRWIQSLRGPGTILIDGKRKGTGPMQMTLSGSRFTFFGSRLEIPSWSAFSKGPHLDVHVNAQTKDGQGQVAVAWIQNSAKKPADVDVSVSSMTVGDIFDVFAVHPSTPIGVEPWKVQDGHFQGQVMPNGRVHAEDVALRFQNLTVQTTGQIDFSTTPVQAHFVGELSNVHLAPFLESLGARPAPLTGIANADFNLRFPVDAHWLKKIDGRVKAESRDGFIHAGKMVNRIAGFLNLSKLLKPTDREKATKPGFRYASASITATLNQGVLESRNLKIRADNMNIGGMGHVNLPAQTIDAKIQLQLMNIVNDTLSAVPVVKRIITADTGLIQIPLRLSGKLDNPDMY